MISSTSSFTSSEFSEAVTTEENVLYVDDDFLIVYKESGLDSVPLKGKDGPTLLSSFSPIYPEIASGFGRNYWEGGVLHRLDRGTSGLVLIARNKSFYDKISSLQASGGFLKKYVALTDESNNLLEGFPPSPSDLRKGTLIRSGFRAYGCGRKSVRPTLEGMRSFDGKVYETKLMDVVENRVYVEIERGFRHQIRAHLAWLKHPITGDELYGGRKSERLMLESYSISFSGFSFSIESRI